MKKSILFMLFLLSISYSVFGQVTVNGKVVDENGKPMIGFIIKVKDTLQGTVTDLDGKFEIEVKDENTILVFERHNNDEPLEIKASEINGDIFLYRYNNLLICQVVGVPIQRSLFEINYWSGVFYNPYGISFTTSKYIQRTRTSVVFGGGYSTNFTGNSDFYGEIGIEIFKRYISYKFQQTTFHKSEIENRITTHLLESSSYLRFIKTRFLYGLGHQAFSKTEIESSKISNYGIHLGLSKYIRFARLNISAKSFYWQDYWAWEANLNKSFSYKKLRLNTAVSYRQTTQNFKEINLTLGYIF